MFEWSVCLLDLSGHSRVPIERTCGNRNHLSLRCRYSPILEDPHLPSCVYLVQLCHSFHCCNGRIRVWEQQYGSDQTASDHSASVILWRHFGAAAAARTAATARTTTNRLSNCSSAVACRFVLAVLCCFPCLRCFFPLLWFDSCQVSGSGSSCSVCCHHRCREAPFDSSAGAPNPYSPSHPIACFIFLFFSSCFFHHRDPTLRPFLQCTRREDSPLWYRILRCSGTTDRLLPAPDEASAIATSTPMWMLLRLRFQLLCLLRFHLLHRLHLRPAMVLLLRLFVLRAPLFTLRLSHASVRIPPPTLEASI